MDEWIHGLTGYRPRAVVQALCKPDVVNLPFSFGQLDKENHLKQEVKHEYSESIKKRAVRIKYFETQLSNIPIMKIS